MVEVTLRHREDARAWCRREIGARGSDLEILADELALALAEAEDRALLPVWRYLQERVPVPPACNGEGKSSAALLIESIEDLVAFERREAEERGRRERDEEIGAFAARVAALYGMEDKSWLHLVTHIENAITNARADAAVASQEIASLRAKVKALEDGNVDHCHAGCFSHAKLWMQATHAGWRSGMEQAESIADGEDGSRAVAKTIRSRLDSHAHVHEDWPCALTDAESRGFQRALEAAAEFVLTHRVGHSGVRGHYVSPNRDVMPGPDAVQSVLAEAIRQIKEKP